MKYAKFLKAGISREEAEAHVQLIAEVTEDDLTTKPDIKNFETKLATSVERLKHKIDISFERLEHKLLQLEYRMTIKFGAIEMISLAVIAAIKLL